MPPRNPKACHRQGTYQLELSYSPYCRLPVMERTAHFFNIFYLYKPTRANSSCKRQWKFVYSVVPTAQQVCGVKRVLTCSDITELSSRPIFSLVPAHSAHEPFFRLVLWRKPIFQQFASRVQTVRKNIFAFISDTFRTHLFAPICRLCVPLTCVYLFASITLLEFMRTYRSSTSWDLAGQ